MSYTTKNPERATCEQNIASALRASPIIGLMVTAMERAGCRIIPDRHFACEYCFGGSDNVLGAYDRTHNQIVICSNRCTDSFQVQQILFHELIHMYDYCSSKVDFAQLSHLACTEIRAANLAHCSSPYEVVTFPERKDCVKGRAVNSVLAMAAGISRVAAADSVDKVFKKCYADLEPVGRTLYGGQCEKLALREFWNCAKLLGSKSQ